MAFVTSTEDAGTEETTEALAPGDESEGSIQVEAENPFGISPNEDAVEDETEEVETAEAGETEEVEEEVEEEAPKPKKGKRPEENENSRYSKRIQQLARQRKAAVEETNQIRTTYQTEIAQARQYLQEYGGQLQQSQIRMAEMAKELEFLKSHRQQEDEANLSPVDRLKAEIRREALGELQPKFQKELETRDKRFNDFLAEQQQTKQRAESVARINSYREQVQHAVTTMLEPLSDEVRTSLEEPLAFHVLNYATALNRPITDAAREFDRVARRYTLAMMQVAGKKNGAQIQKSKQAPKIQKGGAGRNVQQGGFAQDAYQAAVKRGFRGDVFDFMSAQRRA